MDKIDISCSQPARSNRPAHNGRLRPRRTSPLLSSLWNISPFLGESSLRIHLRPGTPRQHLFAHNPVTYVTTVRRYIVRSITSHPQFFTPFLHINLHSKRIRFRILPVTSGVDKFSGRHTSNGWNAGICVDKLGDCVVHIQQLWYVLRCGKDERYAWVGSISTSLILHQLWHYGYLFE
jgi:hypothetical protein